MYTRKAKLVDFCRLAVFGLILVCLTDVIVAQTFNYSRGWTNGKRRSPMSSAHDVGRNNEPESFDIWHMQRLKRLLELSHCYEESPPREPFERAEDDFNRARRNAAFDALSYLNSLIRTKI